MKPNLEVTDEQLDAVFQQIKLFEYPAWTQKMTVCLVAFREITSWNMRKVRAAVSMLQERGFPIIAHNGGYSTFGDDPEPIIAYLNKEYHRVYMEEKKNDQMFAAFKRKYGDELSKKIQQLPQQSFIGIDLSNKSDNCVVTVYPNMNMQAEPIYMKSYSKDGTLHDV